MNQLSRPPGPQTSVLVLTAAPDDRPSTRALELMVDEVDHRPPATATLWYLRSGPEQTPRAGSRIVDSLRTWPPAAVLDRFGLRRPAGWLRGRRLRHWLKQIEPTVVVLDDGLGERVIRSLRPSPHVVVRVNEIPPDDVGKERPAATEADLTIVPAGIPTQLAVVDGARSIEQPLPVQRSRAAGGFARPGAVAEVRRRHGLPEDALLVVGWGDDGWLDGPDLFVRVLWALEHRHGVTAHGAWFGLSADPDELDRLRREADRCGVGARFHQRPEDPIETRFSGDAAFVPYRSATGLDDLLEVACTGSLVVAFEAAAAADPLIRTVPDLDVERAAAEIARGIDLDREQRSATARGRFEPGPVDDLLALG